MLLNNCKCSCCYFYVPPHELNIITIKCIIMIFHWRMEEKLRCLKARLWHKTVESIQLWGRTVMMYCWLRQLNTNCFWYSLLTGKEQRAFARSIAPYHMPGNMLICSSSKTTFERATAIGITIWLSLWKPTVILQNPSVFHRGQIDTLNGMW